MILKKIKSRASGWRPLVLHWRRRRILRPVLRSDRVTSPVSISYFTQVHLHFTTHVNNALLRSADQRTFFANTVYRERVLRESRPPTQIHTDSSTGIYNNYTSVASYTAPGVTKHANSYFSSKHSASIRNQIQQPRQSGTLKIPSLNLVHKRVEELTKSLKTHSHLREREHRSQTFSFHSSSHETLVNTSRTQFDRTEQLVWRDAQPANVTATNQQQPVRTTTVETHAQSASPISNSPTPQQITKLDPRLVDQLAEDVIRRVEKRALVERQRRGL